MTVTPDVAAAMLGVSTAYLRTLEKEDPAFCATWRRGTLVLYDVAALRRFFTPPPRDFVPPVTGGTLPAKLVPDELLSAKAAGPLPLERRPEMARSREGVPTRRVVPKTSG